MPEKKSFARRLSENIKNSDGGKIESYEESVITSFYNAKSSPRIKPSLNRSVLIKEALGEKEYKKYKKNKLRYIANKQSRAGVVG